MSTDDLLARAIEHGENAIRFDTGAFVHEGDRLIDRLAAALREATGRADQAETERDALRAELDAAQLRSIEARNPGIDMDEVRRIRAALAAPTGEDQNDG